MKKTVRSRINEWLSEPTVFLFVVTCLTILAGIVLAEVQPWVGYKLLLLVVGIVLAVFLIALLALANPLKRQMQQTLNAISSLVEPSSIPWLLETSQLTAYEKGAKAEEIWLLSSDLLDDIEGGPFEDIVKSKLRTGTSYVYFVPNLPEIHTRVEILRAAHKYNAHLRFVYLPDSFFFLVPKLDIVIYNPLSHDSRVRCAFMGIPDTMGTSHYHAKVSFEFVDRLVGVLLGPYQNDAGNSDISAAH